MHLPGSCAPSLDSNGSSPAPRPRPTIRLQGRPRSPEGTFGQAAPYPSGGAARPQVRIALDVRLHHARSTRPPVREHRSSNTVGEREEVPEMQQDWSERCARWKDVRTEWLEVDGVRVHLLRADGPSHGSPQLLLHGLGGCATNWIEVIGDLARHGPVVAPDLPGFGRTEPLEPGRAGVPDLAGFLVRLLDELGWQQATVHGNSMGGLLAIHLASLASGRVSRLVLTAPALPTPRSALHRISSSTLARFAPFVLPGLGRPALRLLSALSPERYWQQTARYLHGDPDRVPVEASEVGLEDVVFGRGTRWRTPAFVAAAESLVRALLAPGELLRLIDAAELPVLVIWGEADRLVCRAVIDHVAERRPDWDLAVLPSVGHVPMLEAPQEFVETASSWIDEEVEVGHAALAAA
jgi:pimeloyl-ACP methyl ester carboxylesterase